MVDSIDSIILIIRAMYLQLMGRGEKNSEIYIHIWLFNCERFGATYNS